MPIQTRIEVPVLLLAVLAVLPGALLVWVLGRPDPAQAGPVPAEVVELEGLQQSLGRIEALVETPAGTVVERGPAVPADPSARRELLELLLSDRDAALDRVFGMGALELYRLLGRPDLVTSGKDERHWTYAVEGAAADRLVVALNLGMVQGLRSE